jgi:hypothetical protein
MAGNRRVCLDCVLEFSAEYRNRQPVQPGLLIELMLTREHKSCDKSEKNS